MTSYYPFAPSVNVKFQFQAVLDGQTYNIQVPWNTFGQGWYIYVYDLSNNLIVTRRVVGSPVGVNIESVSWSHGFVTLVTSIPHRYIVGGTVSVLVSGCSPDTYNGQVLAFVTDRYTLSYPLASDPGDSTAVGVVNYNINMVAGYFATSTLVYRQANTQFEVSP